MDKTTREWTGLEVAVIGINGRLPGANNLKEFWENLKNGIDSISFFSPGELIDRGVSSKMAENPKFVRAKGLIEMVEFFDPYFFNFTPMEAEVMDPQLRIFYECVWQTLETSGYNPETYDGAIGLYAGASNNRWWEMKAFTSEKAGFIGAFSLDHLIDRDFLSTRLAHRLNLKGPAITLKTACSTTLVAVDLAFRGLLTNQCDIAVAGGVSYVYLKERGYFYVEGMIKSPDGHCRAFDENAQGVVFSDGMGVVVLKRLQDAIADRDTILAVIKGIAVNNDGARKGTYESPCVQGQAEVIRRAHEMAGVDPETITYVEAHGTGTIIGDPIEIEGLKQAFNTQKKGYCAIGSVKTNVGHTDTAAGITGFIKAVLALQHRLIPPSINFKQANPKIDFENSPFYVNARLSEWKPGSYPWLRAGVSSFGVGGTNVHVVLEEAPEPPITGTGRPWQMIMLSARTEPDLTKATENLAAYFKKIPTLHRSRENQTIKLADAVYTLQTGRKAFKHRKMLVTSSIDDAIRRLEASNDPSSPDFGSVHQAVAREKNQLIFMFPGQGTQYVNMGLDLYRTEPVFREEMDRCFEILEPLIGYDIKEILYPGEHKAQGAERKANKRHALDAVRNAIDQTEIAQPLLFVFEYALARLLTYWGLKPYAMIGHSIGEYTAACLSGVFSLEDGLRIVAARGQLMQEMPPGAMLSVTLSEEELKPMLSQYKQLSLAAVNTTGLCVVSGPQQAIDAYENQCKTSGYNCRQLHTSHAFHSAMMGPILHLFEDIVKEISFSIPKLPYMSNLTGQWITTGDARSPAYWTRHLRGTVRFNDGLTRLLKDPDSIFIEVGPGQSLATFARKHSHKKPGHIIINPVRHPNESCTDVNYMLNNLGQLWLYGVDIDWASFYREEKRQRVPLPTYPFHHQRFWLDNDPGKIGRGITARAGQQRKKQEIKEWFYTPSWKRSLIPVYDPEKTNIPLNWLFFMDKQGLGNRLAERLKQFAPGNRNRIPHIIKVHQGETFSSSGNGEYMINPGISDDYETLIAHLKNQDRIPGRIVHLWNITAKDTREADMKWDEDHEARGFYSLIYLARALGKHILDETIALKVLTDHMQEVTGEEQLWPQKATVLGPVMVIPLEYPQITCSSIDVILPQPGDKQEDKLLARLAAELVTHSQDRVIAYRKHYRWVQTFEPFPLEKPGENIPHLQERGVYLVTGGLGGIGMVIARHLARSVNARLILTGRSPLPQEEQWQEWLAKHSPQDKTSRKIRRILELKETGTEVMVCSADVANMNQMKAVITAAEKQLGTINGIFHAAGVPGGGMIQLKTREQANKVLAPKIKGTLVLNKIFQHHDLDFFILCSSINSILPLLGQVDYYAANAFMDAFAYYKTSTGVFTVSINWDTWQELGMAVEAARQLIEPGEPPPGVMHPLLHRRITEEPQLDIYVTYFSLDKHWVLEEHKISQSGKGLVPGVTYLEMAREAMAKHGGNGAVEIQEVYFFNPLVVGENEEKEVRFILKKQASSKTGRENNVFDFQVQSRTGQGEDNWQKHALGKIQALERPGEPVIHDIGKIAAACNTKKTDLSGNTKEDYTRKGLLIFGPRWHNLKQLHLGENQGLAHLELSERFAPEVEVFKLHPALLDSAAGFLFGHVGNSAYIPFSYQRITLKSPLPNKVFSYSRLVKDQGDELRQEALKFDITIMDEQGVELVDIKEFTMLQVSEEVKAKIKVKEQAAAAPEFLSPTLLDTGSQELTHRQKEFLKNGILPSEGIEVFNRILSSALPQVVVSTLDLPTRFEESPGFINVLSKETLKENKDKSTVAYQPRPTLSTAYAAPKTSIEKTIANVWQELLGIQQIGIHDNFFDLGGDSLNIVQLNTKLKKVLKREIPVAVMFSYLTIHSFVHYLNQKEQGQGNANEEIDRSDEIEKSKKRMKAVKRQR